MAGIPFPSVLPAGSQSSRNREFLKRSKSFSQSASDVTSRPVIRFRRVSNCLFFDALGGSCSFLSEQPPYPNHRLTGGADGHEQRATHALLGAQDGPLAVESLDPMEGFVPPLLLEESGGSSSLMSDGSEREPRAPGSIMMSWAVGAASVASERVVGVYRGAQWWPQPRYFIHLPPYGPSPPPPAASPRLPTRQSTAQRNVLNLALIADGQDTRTTVMFRNIPNGMSVQDLLTCIASVCPRKIDFLYLRMDFNTGRNCGYAFVNFITLQDLLCFAQATLGQKWHSMFPSGRVMHMTYADIQGKQALVEQFKNSRVMTQRESWQPKIFYSNPGPEQGLPEPFPGPAQQQMYTGGQRMGAVA